MQTSLRSTSRSCVVCWLAAAATAAGSFAVIGAPTYGTTSSLSWNGYPQKPTVWYDDGGPLTRSAC